jgi:hypothetical protein
MRLRSAAIVASAVLAGCAANPQQLCATLVAPPWEYVGPDASFNALLDASLPRVPYKTNEGRSVRIVQHLWYRVGELQLLACTLARHARDDCSVRTTQFVRTGEVWAKTHENEVMCNVLASTHDNSLVRRSP